MEKHVENTTGSECIPACGTMANRWAIEDIGGHSFSLHFRFDDLHFGALVKLGRNLEWQGDATWIYGHGDLLIWGMVLQFLYVLGYGDGVDLVDHITLKADLLLCPCSSCSVSWKEVRNSFTCSYELAFSRILETSCCTHKLKNPEDETAPQQLFQFAAVNSGLIKGPFSHAGRGLIPNLGAGRMVFEVANGSQWATAPRRVALWHY
jgi:hypothetical protein